MNDPLGRIGAFAARRRLLVALAYLALSLVLLVKGRSIHLETSLIDLLPRGTASADDYRELLETRGTLDRLLISIAGEDADAVESAAADLKDDLRRTDLFTDLRYGVEPKEGLGLATRAIEHLPVLLPPGRVQAAAARLEPAAIHEAVESLKRRAGMPGFAGPMKALAAIDPLGLLPLITADRAGLPAAPRPDPLSGLFLSEGGRRILIVGTPVSPPTEIAFSHTLMEAVEAAEQRLRGRTPEGARLRFDHAGGHVFALEDERRVRHDAAYTSLFALGGVALIYLLVVRRPALWAAVLVPVGMSTVWTLGLASIYPGSLNMITVAFAAILLGIGDDAMIHMYLRTREEIARGLRGVEAVAATLRGTGRGVIVSTLTTTAAFLSLAFVRFRGLEELGIIAAMGMVALLIGALIFFPAALSWLAAREERRPAPPLRVPLRAILSLHAHAVRRRRAALLAVILTTAVMGALALQVRVSKDLRAIRGADPAAAAMERVLKPFGVSSRSEALFVFPRADVPVHTRIDYALQTSARLEALCEEWVREGRLAGCDLPSVATPPESVQRVRFAAVSALPWEKAIETLGAEARAAGLEESFFRPFVDATRGYGDWGRARIEIERKAEVPVARLDVTEASAVPGVADLIRSRLGDDEVGLASIALVSGDLARIVTEDFSSAAWIVALVTSILVAGAFRGARLTLLTLAPVALGVVWMLGTLAITGVELNLMSLMGLPIVLGLGVDFGVYMVDRWSRGSESAAKVLEHVAPAIVAGGLTTIAGFAALMTARLAGLRTLGLAVVLGAGFTLLAAIVVLPLLLQAVPLTAAQREKRE